MIRAGLNAMLRRLGLEPRPGARSGGSFPRDPFEAQRRLLAGLGRRELVIVDGGAHHGSTARRYRAAFPAARLYCFEPFPDSVARLREAFRDDANVTVIAKALAETAGRRTFHVNAYDAASSLLPRPGSSRRYYPSFAGPTTSIEVETVTLDGFLTDEGLDGVDILKLDIQGGERLALIGGSSLLGSGRLDVIYTEAMFVPHYEHGPLFCELCDLVAPFGFSLFDLYDLRRAANGQLRFGDALLVSDRLRREAIDASPPEP